MEAIRDELMSHFHELCRGANVTDLPAKGLDITPVLDDYFNQKPSFAGGKKKSEFPDAFTARILINWCEEQDRKAVVISGDGDWAGVQHARLEVLDQVAKFLGSCTGT